MKNSLLFVALGALLFLNHFESRAADSKKPISAGPCEIVGVDKIVTSSGGTEFRGQLVVSLPERPPLPKVTVFCKLARLLSDSGSLECLTAEKAYVGEDLRIPRKESSKVTFTKTSMRWDAWKTTFAGQK